MYIPEVGNSPPELRSLKNRPKTGSVHIQPNVYIQPLEDI